MRRGSLVVLAVALLFGLAPVASHASCYPVPAQYCPPGAIKVTQSIPYIPMVPSIPAPNDPNIGPVVAAANQQIATVNQQITTVNGAIATLNDLIHRQSVPNPIYGVWPEANLAIVDAGGLQFAPPNLNVRQSGKLYFHNLDGRSHIIEETGCSGACRILQGINAFEFGASARFIILTKEKFPTLGETVNFRCRLHPVMTGSLVIS